MEFQQRGLGYLSSGTLQLINTNIHLFVEVVLSKEFNHVYHKSHLKK